MHPNLYTTQKQLHIETSSEKHVLDSLSTTRTKSNYLPMQPQIHQNSARRRANMTYHTQTAKMA